MKKRIKCKVVNADWEIRKFKLKRGLQEFSKNSKECAKFCAKAFFSGAGFATVFIIRSKLRNF